MHLFVGPHPDDVPFSCGGTAAQLSRGGAQTGMLTVMAADPPAILPDSPFVRELHERWGAGVNPFIVRRQEDRDAAAALGITKVLFSPVPDSIYRTFQGAVLYASRDAIFGPVDRHDPARPTLINMPDQVLGRPTHLYFPLGVGHHVDHQLVRDWGILLRERLPAVQVIFYQDYPYAGQAGAVEKALEFFGGVLESFDVVLTEEDIQAKLTSLRAYKSQLHSFWPDLDTMDAAVRGHLESVGGGVPVERFWRYKAA